MIQSSKQLKKVVAMVLVLTAFGTTSFMLSEHLSFWESLYRTIYILIAHYDAEHMVGWYNRIVILILVIGSLLLIAYLLTWFAEYMIGLGDNLKRRQMKAKLSKIKDHYIVCGLGRVGSQVMDELASEGVTFVGLDRDEERVKVAIQKGYTAIVADSTGEDVLQMAHVERARGMVASLGDDSSNLFITLAARQLNPAIFIVARANREENRQRLSRAGADRIAMPYQIGGYHMATMMIRPNVVDFLEILSKNNSSDLQIEELLINRDSKLVGEKLSALSRNKTGVTVLAINSSDGTSRVNPTGNEVVYAGDKVILMGTRAQLDGLNGVR